MKLYGGKKSTFNGIITIDIVEIILALPPTRYGTSVDWKWAIASGRLSNDPSTIDILM